MNRFAQQTSVSPDRSRAEIQAVLTRYGATAFMYGEQGGRALICFQVNARMVKFVLDLPVASDRDFTHTPTGRLRSQAERLKAHDQEVRRRWRALCLGIKAKLEFVQSGISVFEKEFLAHLVLPSGEQVGDYVLRHADRLLSEPSSSALLLEFGQESKE